VPGFEAHPPRSIVTLATVGGRFALRRRLHTGATGEVWSALATDGQIVALTLAGASAEARLRVAVEHATLAGLAHAAIVKPLAFVDEPPHVALVTEYLPGGDLVSLAGAAPHHWLAAIAAVADALAYLHERHIVHRDIKLRNVMFDSAGRARLIDFGSAAKVGGPRDDVGTTPEYRFGEPGPVTCADDAYAFAILIYELMAGRLPFGRAPRGEARAAVAPLPAEYRANQALVGLEALVLNTLAARALADVVSMQAYRDGIKSALAEELDRK
jgi:serine/threonine protein kinase